MKNKSLDLPQTITRFIAARIERGDILAALLYGSYARGTQTEHSDVDIIFILDKGYKSKLVMHEGIEFEVLEVTKSNLYAYWQKNWDEDRHWYLWKDAKAIFDPGGEGKEIIEHARSLVGERFPWQKKR